MLNWIFLGLIVIAVLTGAFNGRLPEVTKASIDSAKASVDLAIGLVGQMALWLGFMAILREAGLMASLARRMKPVMTRLFPDVPPEHPAMSAMIMNFAANMLGLANAATPFGLKAMTELQKLNRLPSVSTNAMALFLAINSSGLAVLPLGVVAVRATLGSNDPAGIVVPTLIATSLSTLTAILMCKLLSRLPVYAPERFAPAGGAPGPGGETAAAAPRPGDEKAMEQAREAAAERPGATGWRLWVAIGLTLALLGALGRAAYLAPADQAGWTLARQVMSDWLLPVLMLAIVTFGFARQVKVYEVFVAAAKEGFQIAITIIPFLVAILVAIGMFRASGAMEALVGAIGGWTARIGFPAEALPMALIRPLSGSGGLAVMMETMKANGPDSFVGYLVSILNGSMETTFYVLALYFGSIGVREPRHTVGSCLAGDFAGIIAAALMCHLFFGYLL